MGVATFAYQIAGGNHARQHGGLTLRYWYLRLYFLFSADAYLMSEARPMPASRAHENVNLKVSYHVFIRGTFYDLLLDI